MIKSQKYSPYSVGAVVALIAGGAVYVTATFDAIAENRAESLGEGGKTVDT